jgi:hypothetical protein
LAWALISHTGVYLAQIWETYGIRTNPKLFPDHSIISQTIAIQIPYSESIWDKHGFCMGKGQMVWEKFGIGSAAIRFPNLGQIYTGVRNQCSGQIWPPILDHIWPSAWERFVITRLASSLGLRVLSDFFSDYV